MIPSESLSNDDIMRIYQEAKNVMSCTDLVCCSTSKQEIQTHRSELSKAESGVESLVNHIMKELGNLKNSLAAVKALKNDIHRCDERAKNSYYILRDSEQHS